VFEVDVLTVVSSPPGVVLATTLYAYVTLLAMVSV